MLTYALYAAFAAFAAKMPNSVLYSIVDAIWLLVPFFSWNEQDKITHSLLKTSDNYIGAKSVANAHIYIDHTLRTH